MDQDDAYWLGVHVRFTQGDLAAWEEIAKHFLPLLSFILCYRHLGMDEHMASESAENALLTYWADPQRFDATRGTPLGYWLLLQARGYLSNLLRGARRHRAHQKAVGVADRMFEKFLSEKGFEWTMYTGRGEEALEEEKQILGRLLLRLNSYDLAGVELLISDDAKFEDWVNRLGMASLPNAEQRSRVCAEKGRLKKKLRRLAKQ